MMDFTAELYVFGGGTAAFVFVGGEYAGSVESHSTPHNYPRWTAHSLYAPELPEAELMRYPNMWAAVSVVVWAHKLTVMKAVVSA
jgi:hypothetical protein